MNMEQATVEGGAKLLQNLVTSYSKLWVYFKEYFIFPSLNIINLISFLTQNLLIIHRWYKILFFKKSKGKALTIWG